MMGLIGDAYRSHRAHVSSGARRADSDIDDDLAFAAWFLDLRVKEVYLRLKRLDLRFEGVDLLVVFNNERFFVSERDGGVAQRCRSIIAAVPSVFEYGVCSDGGVAGEHGSRLIPAADGNQGNKSAYRDR
jgi:hypothetical protein